MNGPFNGAQLVHGVVAPGFEAVAEEFGHNLVERGEIGAAVALVVDGTPVVDLWGGLADRDRGRPWDPDTVAVIFSGTKGFVAACLLLLIERRALDLDAPVCAYWPEFAAAGKDRILVRHVVSHRAGLPGLVTPVTPIEATDDAGMARLLAEQPAIHPPGAAFYYHALTFGWLCGELVRRIDGRSVGRFFRDEIATPLGLDAWIGLPDEHEPRVARLVGDAGFGAQRHDDQARPERDPVAWSIWGNPGRFTTGELPANARYWHRAEVPASNGIASARSIARLYGCLARGGEIDGVRLVSPETVELGTAGQVRDVEPYLNRTMAYAVGFQLQTEFEPLGPPQDAFGHVGAGGSVHAAWPEWRAGISYLTNTLRDSDDGRDPRSTALLQAAHDALASVSAELGQRRTR
jgi:CubicO group peptidase (beta-lactamase class C family)